MSGVFLVSVSSAKKDYSFSSKTRKIKRLLYGKYQMNNIQRTLEPLDGDRPRKVSRAGTDTSEQGGVVLKKKS